MSIKCYSELIKMDSFDERFEYLNLSGVPFEETFGYDRYINQKFYVSAEWRRIRNSIILRDNGLDLGVEGYPIGGKIYIHHMNPIDKRDILDVADILVDPEYLISCSYNTHKAIHYGTIDMARTIVNNRRPNDTCPWKH